MSSGRHELKLGVGGRLAIPSIVVPELSAPDGIHPVDFDEAFRDGSLGSVVVFDIYLDLAAPGKHQLLLYNAKRWEDKLADFRESSYKKFFRQRKRELMKDDETLSAEDAETMVSELEISLMVQDALRSLNSHSCTCKFDSQGRITIPERFTNSAGIVRGRDVVFFASSTVCELWAADAPQVSTMAPVPVSFMI